MADTKKLEVHGVPQPKGKKWLDEVRVDATRNAVEHLKRQAEEREFERAKARGLTPAEILEKGKKDLKSYVEETSTLEYDADDDEGFEDEDEGKTLDEMTKAELLQVAKDEGVTVDPSKKVGEVRATLKKALEEEA